MIVPMIGFGIPGGYEWLIVLLIVILLFGAGRIPDLARGLGSGISEFKKGLKEADPNEQPVQQDETTDVNSSASRDVS